MTKWLVAKHCGEGQPAVSMDRRGQIVVMAALEVSARCGAALSSEMNGDASFCMSETELVRPCCCSWPGRRLKGASAYWA